MTLNGSTNDNITLYLPKVFQKNNKDLFQGRAHRLHNLLHMRESIIPQKFYHHSWQFCPFAQPPENKFTRHPCCSIYNNRKSL